MKNFDWFVSKFYFFSSQFRNLLTPIHPSYKYEKSLKIIKVVQQPLIPHSLFLTQSRQAHRRHPHNPNHHDSRIEIPHNPPLFVFICILIRIGLLTLREFICRSNQVTNYNYNDISLHYFIIQMEQNQECVEVFEEKKITEESIQVMSLGVEEVQFIWCTFEEGKWRSVIKALLQKPKLATLTIKQDNLVFGEDQFKQLLSSKLLKLHLEGRFKEENWLPHICSMTNIKQLTLVGSGFNPVSITQIQQIQKLTNLTKLTLNNFKIDSKGAQAISNLPCLTELDLSYNNVGDEGCREISKMKNLKILKLYYNGISNVGVAYMSQLVNLQFLNLSQNNIGSVGTHLTKLKNLQILNLWSSNISDDGAKSISTILSLQWLYLYNNKIGAEGISALCRLPNLEVFQFRYNKVGNEALCEVRKLTKLKKTILYCCNIDSNGGLFIERMNNLYEIQIASNNINSAERDKIKRRLPNRNIYDR